MFTHLVLPGLFCHGGQAGDDCLDEDGGYLLHEGETLLVPEDGGDESLVVAALLDGEGEVLAVDGGVGEVGEVVVEVGLFRALGRLARGSVLSVAGLAIPSPSMNISRSWIQVTSMLTCRSNFSPPISRELLTYSWSIKLAPASWPWHPFQAVEGDKDGVGL